jgi:hypothetical protein
MLHLHTLGAVHAATTITTTTAVPAASKTSSRS